MGLKEVGTPSPLPIVGEKPRPIDACRAGSNVAMDTGRSDDPSEDATEVGRPETTFSAESRLDWVTDVTTTAALDGGAPELV